MDSWDKRTDYVWWQWHILIVLFPFPVTRVHCGLRLCPLYNWKSTDFKCSAMMEANISVTGTLNITFQSEGEIHCFWHWDYLTSLQREEIPTHSQRHNWPVGTSAKAPPPLQNFLLPNKLRLQWWSPITLTKKGLKGLKTKILKMGFDHKLPVTRC